MPGLLRTSFLDYPGKICATLFLTGCPFRCPFCHNPDLVFGEDPHDIDWPSFIDFLDTRKDVLDGICITGGEPLLHFDVLLRYLPQIKGKGFLIKLDTNGYFPKELESLLKNSLVDYVAMDIKSSLEKYEKVTGVIGIDIDRIKNSINIIKAKANDYEFRTTVLPEFYSSEDALEIGQLLKEAKRYTLQQFSANRDMIDPSYKNKQQFKEKDFNVFKKILNPYIKEVNLPL